MPVYDMPFGKRTVFAVIAGLFLVSIVAFMYQNGYYYNKFLVFVAILWVAGFIGIIVSDKRAARSCVSPARAFVERIDANEKRTYLVLSYNAAGRKQTSKVLYEEKQLPAIGQDVGIYFNPDKPRICMLAIYKKHKPGWSIVNKPEAINPLPAYIMGGIFIALWVALIVVGNVKSGDYSESALAVVVDYESEYELHGATIGTYEYRPIVEYDLHGYTQRARSLESEYGHSYKTGDIVTVRYAPDKPDVVIIDDFPGSNMMMGLIIFMGVGFVALGIIGQVLWKKRAKRPMREFEIDFM